MFPFYAPIPSENTRKLWFCSVVREGFLVILDSRGCKMGILARYCLRVNGKLSNSHNNFIDDFNKHFSR